MILASILASFWMAFGILFTSFSVPIFASIFRWPFSGLLPSPLGDLGRLFRFLVENGSQNGTQKCFQSAGPQTTGHISEPIFGPRLLFAPFGFHLASFFASFYHLPASIWHRFLHHFITFRLPFGIVFCIILTKTIFILQVCKRSKKTSGTSPSAGGRARGHLIPPLRRGTSSVTAR